MFAEPHATALVFTTIALLLGISVVLSRWSERLSVPLALAFLGLGMLAGSEGIGGIAFSDYGFAYRLGSAALVFIIFDGGLNTPMSVLKRAVRPAGLLATVGIVGTAGLVAVAARMLGVPWAAALLLGVVVSSTDAAAVFSVLRGSGIHLKRRVGGTLEVESGINDPLAVILTQQLALNLAGKEGALHPGMLAAYIAMQIGIGIVAGVAIGYGGRWALSKFRLNAGGLYSVFTIALALLAFGAPALIEGSGFLAVYVAGLILGNGPLPYRGALLRVHDAGAWLSQVGMFLLLGLLVNPSELVAVAWTGLVLALFLALFARPVMVAICLAPFGYTVKDVAYVGIVGLRGAVPIVLATYPVLIGAPGAEWLFNLVFFIVVVNAVIPGSIVPWLTRKLELESVEPPRPRAVLEIESARPLIGKLQSYYVDEELPVAGSTIADLPFPERSAVTMVVRGDEMIAPRGGTVLKPGDHVYVLMHPDDQELIHLMFGRSSDD